jgi:hypothetical protein
VVAEALIDSDIDCLEELLDLAFAKEEDQHLLGDFTGEDNAGFCFNDVHSWTIAGVQSPFRVDMSQKALEGVEVANLLDVGRLWAGLLHGILRARMLAIRCLLEALVVCSSVVCCSVDHLPPSKVGSDDITSLQIVACSGAG